MTNEIKCTNENKCEINKSRKNWRATAIVAIIIIIVLLLKGCGADQHVCETVCEHCATCVCECHFDQLEPVTGEVEPMAEPVVEVVVEPTPAPTATPAPVVVVVPETVDPTPAPEQEEEPAPEVSPEPTPEVEKEEEVVPVEPTPSPEPGVVTPEEEPEIPEIPAEPTPTPPAEEEQEEEKVHEHVEGDVIVENEIAATCTANGSFDEVVYCVECNEELVRNANIVEAKGHVEAVVNGYAATCENDGLTDGVKCEICEEIIVAQEVIPAAGHIAGEEVVENEVEVDCENAGSYDVVINCVTCDKELSRETIVVDALGHKEGAVVVLNSVEATCTTAGGYENVVNCEICGKEMNREVVSIPAMGHIEDVIPGMEPTCTEDGYTDGVKCVVCDEIIFAPIALYTAGHVKGDVIVENVVEATCQQAGSFDEVIRCEICDEELARNTVEVPAADHKAAPAVVENEVKADCENTGSYDVVINCEDCGKELSRETIVVDALGHDIVKDAAKAPTCEDTGLTEGEHCTRCDHNVPQEVIPATGHNWAPATEEAPKTCENCGKTEGEPLPKPEVVEPSEPVQPEVQPEEPAEPQPEPEAPKCGQEGHDHEGTCPACGVTYVKPAPTVVNTTVETVNVMVGDIQYVQTTTTDFWSDGSTTVNIEMVPVIS